MSHPTPIHPSISRRRFFSICAPAVGSLILLGAGHSSASATSNVAPDKVPAMLIDVSRCLGCGNCQRCCSAANELACEPPQTSLSAETYTVVEERAVGDNEVRYVKRACMHCLHPACVSACPVGALHQTAEGPVVVDTAKCIGCRYCQYACPFGVPKFEWNKTLGVMHKCTACLERLALGQAPACVAGCPTGALKAGPRGELLKEAHTRIAAHPEMYVNHIYGESEAGGTSRLYISDVPFEQLGFPAIDSSPIARYAEPIVTRTPTLALSVAALSTITFAFLRRRERGLAGDITDLEEK